MGRSIEAVQLEQELTHLFHETTYRVVKHPCRGNTAATTTIFWSLEVDGAFLSP